MHGAHWHGQLLSPGGLFGGFWTGGDGVTGGNTGGWLTGGSFPLSSHWSQSGRHCARLKMILFQVGGCSGQSGSHSHGWTQRVSSTRAEKTVSQATKSPALNIKYKVDRNYSMNLTAWTNDSSSSSEIVSSNTLVVKVWIGMRVKTENVSWQWAIWNLATVANGWWTVDNGTIIQLGTVSDIAVTVLTALNSSTSQIFDVDSAWSWWRCGVCCSNCNQAQYSYQKVYGENFNKNY